MKLLEVQREALNVLRGKRGYGFFMSMGLGKTLTDMTESLELAANGELQRCVTICPMSFREGWVKEIEKWGLGFTPHVYEHGNDWYNNRFANMQHTKPPMFILNYEAIRSEKVQEYVRNFVNGKAAKITADESIQIKTHDSSQTKAAINMAKDFAFRRILCGKPTTQGPHDLWSQLRFIGEIEGFNYFAFRGAFCKMGGFKGKMTTGAKSPERLAGILDPICFKAEKKDWSDLPPKLYTERYYKMVPAQQKQFEDMYNEFVAFITADEFVAVDAAITKYIKLAQIQCGFIIDEHEEVHQLVSDDDNPRLSVLRSTLRDEVTGKLCIPYNHKHSRKLLERALKGYNPAIIGGRKLMADMNTSVEAEKHRFNNDPNCRAILLQTKASRYGHTLLADQNNHLHGCNTMAFFENTYSLDDRSQIEDRIHRTGQTMDECLYVDFIGTLIDKQIVAALQRKEDVYQSVMRHVTARSDDDAHIPQ